MSNVMKLFDETVNPLDGAEELFKIQGWDFERLHEDEITLHMTGQHGEYEIKISWQEHHNAILFSCEYTDMCLREHRMEHAIATIYNINKKIWLGHFDLSKENNAPIFKYTSLIGNSPVIEHIENLIDIALNECERFHSVFDLLTSSEQPDPNQLVLALMDNGGVS